MKLSEDEMWDIVRSTEWLYNEDFPKSETNNKRGIALHKKLKAYFAKQTKLTYELK
jgi:hypothetical protein